METYYGHVRTPGDAILLFEACRIGLLPRVQRRLSEKERLSIRSGSVFVWDEREAGMRRWTDGKSWSASRVSGSFLTYREMEGKRGGSTFAPPKPTTQKAADDGSDDGPDGYRYKPDGLIKQSFSITTSTGQHLHLISYFARSAAAAQNLQQPSNDAQLRHIRPEKGMYPESTVHEQNAIPAVTRGPMTSPAFGNSPHQSAQIAAPYGRPQYAPMTYGPPGWAPPSPMNTPPPHYSPYYHHSPMPPHMHGAYPQPHQQHYPPQLTAFDRAPAPLSNSALPPPPHHQQHQYQSHHPHQLQHHQQHPPPQLTPIHNHPPPPPLPSRPSFTEEHVPRPTIDPALANTHDPKPALLSPRPLDTSAGAPRTNRDRSPATSLPPVSNATTSLPPVTNATTSLPPVSNATTSLPPVSNATTIPSISSLIHETSGGQPPPRPASRSPIGGRHTQDIPMHKMGYDAARDVQALRHLDKATLRF